ncbi:hypothetical protein Tco_0843944, partial [Tanacetum coccineum]
FQSSWQDGTIVLPTQNHVATPSVGNAFVGSTAELLHSEEWSIASSTTVVGLEGLIVEHQFLLELCISKSDLTWL